MNKILKFQKIKRILVKIGNIMKEVNERKKSKKIYPLSYILFSEQTCFANTVHGRTTNGYNVC